MSDVIVRKHGFELAFLNPDKPNRTADIAEIKALINNKGLKGHRSFKDAAKIGELIQALANKCSDDEVIAFKKNKVFGVTSSFNSWLCAARLKNDVMLECNARGLNYDEIGFSRGINLIYGKQEIVKEVVTANKRIRKTKSKSKTPLSEEDIVLIRSHVLDGKTEEERRERRKQAASEYNVALQLVSALTKKLPEKPPEPLKKEAPKVVVADDPIQPRRDHRLGSLIAPKVVEAPTVEAPPKVPKVPKVMSMSEAIGVFFHLRDFVDKYDSLNIITLIEDVEQAAKQCGGVSKFKETLKEILPLLAESGNPNKPRKNLHKKLQKRDNIPREQPSLKHVVYNIIQEHPEGIAVGQITEKVPLTGYQSNAKDLSAVVSQALNSLLMEKEIYPTPQPNTHARLYKVS